MIQAGIGIVGIFVPFFFLGGAYACGWEGYQLGYLLSLFFYFACLILIVYFAVMFMLYSHAKPMAFLYACLLVLCLGVSCWGYHVNPFISAFQSRLRHEYWNIPMIQQWATNVLSIANEKAAKGEFYVTPPKSAYPSWLTESHFPMPTIVILTVQNSGGDPNTENEYDHVELQWSCDRFAKWGLAIGNPTLAPMGQKWADGVYFYSTGPE